MQTRIFLTVILSALLTLSGYAQAGTYPGNTMATAIDIGTISSDFQYSDSQDTEYFSDNFNSGTYKGDVTNDVFYKITLTRALRMIISTCDSELDDPYLFILDSTGKVVFENDDGNRCDNDHHPYMNIPILTEGTYYIVLEGYWENGNITVNMEISEPAAMIEVEIQTLPFFEYTHTFNTAQSPNVYGSSTTNEVFYKLILSSSAEVTIDHCGSALTNTCMYLLDGSMNSIAYNNDWYGTGRCSNAQHAYVKTTLAAGTYYIVSEGYSTDGSITTNIKLKANPTIITVPTFNSHTQYVNTYNTNNSGNAFQGKTTNDIFYKITLSKPTNLSISNINTSMGVSCISVLNGAYRVLHSVNNAFDSTWTPYLNLHNMAAGTYYVVSEGYSQNGNITTSINGTIIYPAGNSMINPINLGIINSTSSYSDTQNTDNFNDEFECQSYKECYLDICNTKDVFYKFTLTHPFSAIISNCNSDINDTYLFILDSNGNVIYDNDYGYSCETDDQSYINIPRLSAGTYYIVSEGYGQNGNITTNMQFTALPVIIDVPEFISDTSYSYTYNTYNGINAHAERMPNDVFYKISLKCPFDIEISHCGSAVADTYLHLLDSSMQKIAFNDNWSGEGKCSNTYHSYLKKLNLAAGIYYVVSEGYNQDGNIITTITATARPTIINVPDFNAAGEYINTYNTNSSSNAFQGKQTNEIFYKITLTEKMDVVITHCGSAMSDTYLSVLDASFSPINSVGDYTGVESCPSTSNPYIKINNMPAGTYYIVSEGKSQNGDITTTIKAMKIIPPYMPNATIQEVGSSDQNYIVTRNLTDFGTLDQIQYYDGLGRPIQQVILNNIATHNDYDAMGRKSKDHIPVVVKNNNGKFIHPSTLTEIARVVTQNDSHPYTETIYEASPMNRITEQYGVGANWYSNGKSVKTAYLTNSSTDCAKYSVSSNYLVRNGYYAANQLFVTKQTDEDGNISYEFKNNLDQVILTRQMNDSDRHDTYYVYDDFGNLCFVISPKAAPELPNGTYSVDHPAVKTLCYAYRYDSRNRCIYKKLPGAHPVYMAYDKADRLVLSQDGEQRHTNNWTIYKYDSMGRMIYTAECVYPYTYESCRTTVQNLLITETFTTGSQPYPVLNTGYSKNYFHLQCAKVYTVNYYDNYDFMQLLPDSVRSKLEYNNSYEPGYGRRHSSAKGLLTGTRTYMLDGSNTYTATAIYYDYDGQALQTRSTNHLGGYDFSYTEYGYTGNIKRILAEHSVNSAHSNPTVELYNHIYDYAGRLIKTTHRLNGGAAVILTENTYDELGRLKTAMPNNRQDLKLTYSYNIRSWLTDIEGQRFVEKLFYNTTSQTGNQLRWNGNISVALYTSGGSNALGFNYDYDGLNRLIEAESFYTWAGLFYGAYTSEYVYDRNGNMTGMFRIEDLDAEDLTMHYQGNRKTHVSYKTDDDYANGYYRDFRTDNCCPPYINGFTDYTHGNTSARFAYNTNGSLTADPYKGVNYTYDILGMPSTISVPAINGTIDYKYSADGEKLSTQYTWHSGLSLDPVENTGKNYTGTNSSKTVQYTGNKVYENGVLKRILLPNGYISGNTYYFYLRDHLGNNSVVAQSNGTVIQRNHFHPFGKLIMGESYMGKDLQPYKFGGKEAETMLGLNQYDFTARTLDEYGRFTTIDPLAESYYSTSPYAYVGNNPINITDPTGMYWVEDDSTLIWNNAAISPETTPEGYTYIGPTANGTDADGNYTYYAQDGKRYNSAPLPEVTINGTMSDHARNMAAASYLGIYQAHADFWSHPLTQFTLSVLPVGAIFKGAGSGVGAISTTSKIANTGAKAANVGTNAVYRGVDAANKVRYVGITAREPALRFAEHAASGTARAGLRYEPIATGLSRTSARIMEQNLINQYGLMKNGGMLYNKINSIAPQYWWQFGINP